MCIERYIRLRFPLSIDDVIIKLCTLGWSIYLMLNTSRRNRNKLQGLFANNTRCLPLNATPFSFLQRMKHGNVWAQAMRDDGNICKIVSHWLSPYSEEPCETVLELVMLLNQGGSGVMLIYDIFFTFLSQHWIASLNWDPWGICLDMNDVCREELHPLVIKYRTFGNIIQWPTECCYCSLWGHFHAMRIFQYFVDHEVEWIYHILDHYSIVTWELRRLISPLDGLSKLTTKIAPRFHTTELLWGELTGNHRISLTNGQ